jgi:hypothetical protein
MNAPNPYRPPPGAPLVAQLDLYAIAKKHAWSKLWISIGMTIGGIVLSAVGLAVGFIVFFGIILVIAGVVTFFSALAAITDPTRELSHLAPNEVTRRQVLRHVEGELTQPSTSTMRTTKGAALLGPTWLVYHDDSTMLVSRREDVLWFYIQTKKNTQTLKVHLRSGKVVDLSTSPADQHLLQGLAHALPHSIHGYDPRWASAPLPVLAQEVDRRRYALSGR